MVHNKVLAHQPRGGLALRRLPLSSQLILKALAPNPFVPNLFGQQKIVLHPLT